MPPSNQMPHIIYVVRDSDDQSILIAVEDITEVPLEKGKWIVVGRYKLDDIEEATLEPKFVTPKGDKRK